MRLEDKVAGAFEEVAEQTFEYKTVLDRDVEVAVQDGRQALASWNFRAVPDNPPAITFAEEVSETKRQALVIPYALVDDYGAVSAVAELRLAQKPDPSGQDAEIVLPDRFDVTGEPEEEAPEILRFNVEDRPPIALEIVLPSLQTRRASGELTEDLTSHPWAGLDVTIELKAEDELGQVGLSEQITYTLPERVFTDALAKAVIEQRKWLAQYPQDGARVARFIEAFTVAPERYFQDMGAYLLLRNAYYKLLHLSTEEELEALYQLLWDIAVRLEEGDLFMAADMVRELQKQLAEALANQKPKDEIDRIMDALRKAIQQYMAALARQGMEDMQRGDIPGMGQQGQSGGNPLEDLLQALEDRLRIGDMDGARNALAELMNQLENMQFGGLSQGGGMGFPMPGMEELGDMIGRQRGLMDETLQESQRSMPSPGQPGGRNGPPRFGFNQPGQGQPQGQDPSQGSGGDPQNTPNTENNGEGGRAPGDLRAQQDALRQELDELLEACAAWAKMCQALSIGRWERWKMRNAIWAAAIYVVLWMSKSRPLIKCAKEHRPWLKLCLTHWAKATGALPKRGKIAIHWAAPKPARGLNMAPLSKFLKSETCNGLAIS